ncbi:MAG TPA: STAS domain-containing protein [Rudaea sp.]
MNTLTIGPGFGIEEAADLRERLKKPARSKKPVTLTCASIDRLHTAALQVLCAFVRDRAQARGDTRIDAPDELRAAAALLGIADTLGLQSPERMTS